MIRGIRRVLSFILWFATATFTLLIVLDTLSDEPPDTPALVFIGIITLLLACLAYLLWPKSPPAHTAESSTSTPAQPDKKINRAQAAAAEAAAPPPLTQHRLTADELAELHRFASECIDDYRLSLEEIRFLRRWFKRHQNAVQDARTYPLYKAVNVALANGRLDDAEADDLYILFSDFCDELDSFNADAAPPTAATPTAVVSIAKPSDTENPPGTAADLVEGAHYKMVYLDSQGQPTDRQIVFRHENKARGTFFATCSEQKLSRTFQHARIVSIVRWDTE